ncbi:MAG TPA: hypothetical protein PK054_01605 [Anaerohalosphaeraceae bacterium]|nr:hypothetical protein [Anaerohalosphaeraceae bacterium]HPP55257.1 hypothetical protein [Anaerohalosphaeraceae bacterium]
MSTPAAFFRRLLSPETVAPLLVLLFGAYLSVLFFGHQAVPNSDFPAFVQTARDILHFRLPASFKRLPGLGILQIALSLFLKGPHPVLTAGLLLNALLYPLCGWLFYLIARRFLGRAAFWAALLALVNPEVLIWLVHPIAEIPLLFFFLLTFWLLLLPSRWAYAAAFGAAFIRYEGAVLILLVWLSDILRQSSLRQRLLSTALAFSAALPTALWVLGQFLTRHSGSGDYLSGYTAAAESGSMVFGRFAQILRQITIQPFFQTPYPPLRSIVILCTVLFWAGLVTAVFLILWKKHTDLLPILVFTAVYFLLHSARTGTRSRYAAPIAWLVLLLWLFGFRRFWLLFKETVNVPKPAVIIVQALLFLIGISTALALVEPLAQIQKFSPRSASVPWVALLFSALFGTIIIASSKGRLIGWTAAVLGITSWALFANQSEIIRKVGNGDYDREFKDLAVWYQKNASPDQKMVTTMPHLLLQFLEGMDTNFVHTQNIDGDTLEEFIEDCRRKNITYLAWDSRLGFAHANSYYKKYRLERIARLGARIQDGKVIMPPEKNGPFHLVGTIRNPSYPKRFILIYRLNSDSN